MWHNFLSIRLAQFLKTITPFLVRLWRNWHSQIARGSATLYNLTGRTLAMSCKTTHVFTLWHNNPTSRNLPEAAVPQIQNQSYIFIIIHDSNIGNDPKDHSFIGDRIMTVEPWNKGVWNHRKREREKLIGSYSKLCRQKAKHRVTCFLFQWERRDNKDTNPFAYFCYKKFRKNKP